MKGTLSTDSPSQIWLESLPVKSRYKKQNTYEYLFLAYPNPIFTYVLVAYIQYDNMIHTYNIHQKPKQTLNPRYY